MQHDMKQNASKSSAAVARVELSEQSEEQRLYTNITRPDIEKFKLFTRMLRNNAVLKKAIVSHK